jgi:hypothetical protein
MEVILTTWKAEVGGSSLEAGLRQKHEIIGKITKSNKGLEA